MQIPELHIDFETRSRVNLIKEGAYNYAVHPSTSLICLSYGFGDDKPTSWNPLSGEPFPQVIIDHIKAGHDRSIHAHNAAFERVIFWYVVCPDYDVPEPPLEMFYCTMAQARARALPGGLDDLGACLGLRTQKDRRGKELIKLLSIPGPPDLDTGVFNMDPDLLEEMYRYCDTDVIVERTAAKMTPPLTDEEWQDYIVNERINDRGLKVDREFAEAAIKYADAEVYEISVELNRITNGQIDSPRQFARHKEWMEIYMDGDDDIRKAMTRVTTDRQTREETRKITLDKTARADILKLETMSPGRIAPICLEFVQLLEDAGRSSISKYKAMCLRSDPDDDRVRGAFSFAGAGQTLRASSQGLQVHNFTRDCSKEPEVLRASLMAHTPIAEGEVMNTLASMLRPSLIAHEGYSYVCSDWAGIEARVLPWLTDSAGGRKMLKVFKDVDENPARPDVYMVAASGIYNVPADAITKPERQIGKVTVLSMGYQGGVKAFQSMARNYGVHIEDSEADKIKKAWRASNPWAVDYWADLDFAATNAVSNPGKSYKVGFVTYMCPENMQALYCMLPSGQVLSYPKPRIETVEGRWGFQDRLTAVKAGWKPKRGETEWGRVQLYGGLLAENNTQAVSASILKRGLRMMDELDWPIVGHVHDEILLEVLDAEVGDAWGTLEDVMKDVPLWAPGLPLEVELWHGKRYKK